MEDRVKSQGRGYAGRIESKEGGEKAVHPISLLLKKERNVTC